MKTTEKKIKDLVEAYGTDGAEELAEEFLGESCIPSICMNIGCSATYEYEPDQDKGWCDECQTNSVKSIYVLLGVI